MRLTMKKWKIALFSVILTLFVALGFITWNTWGKDTSLQVQAASATNYELSMEEGASIRIVGTTGIRFKGSISADKAAGATEYGMLVMDKESLNGAELNVSNAKWKISSATGMNTAEENGVIRFNAVLTNIKDANLTRTYVSRAYVTDASGTYYTPVQERSPFAVASAAYNDSKSAAAVKEAVKTYMVLDVKVDATGEVTVARAYSKIDSESVTAGGNLGASDPKLNAITCTGGDFFGLVINGKRVEMGGGSVVEIGANSYQFTETSVDNNVFTGVSTVHTHAYDWDDSAADQDVYACACGKVEKTFTKDYRAERKEVDFGTNATNIQTPFESGSLIAAQLDDGTGLSVSDSHVNFSNVRDDLQKHGDHTVTVMVRDGDFEHETKLSVRLITGSINTAKGLFDATFANGGVPKYGYYRIISDINYSTATIEAECGVKMDETHAQTAQSGFRGVIYGEKEDGTRPVITSMQRSNGVFGWLINATVKDLIITDTWCSGMHPYGGGLLATVMHDSTLENVEFQLLTTTGAYDVNTIIAGQGSGWIVNRYFSGNTIKNVAFVNKAADVTQFATLFSSGSSELFENYIGYNNTNTFFDCIATGAVVTKIGQKVLNGETSVYTLENTTGITQNGHIHVYKYVGDAAGHIGVCTIEGCNAKTEREAHFGGSANCGSGAACEACGKVYTGATAGVHTNFAWNKLDGYDVYWCKGCHTVQKEVRTDYTDVVMSVDFGAGQTSIGLPLAGHGTIKTAVLGDIGELADGKVTLISADFSDYKDNKQQHGEHDLKVIVNNEGHEHEIHFTVRLITRSFKAGEEAAFRDVVRAVAGDGAVKGLYRITTDLTCDYTTFAENWGAIETGTDYFAGTIVGEKADGSAPVIKVNPQYGGTFHYLQGATFKNLVFEDINYKGSSDQFATLIAAHIIDTTLENVTFKVTGGTASDQKTSGGVYGWLANKTTTGCTFVNVNFENTVAGLSVGNVFTCNSYSGNTFENCYIAGFDSVTYIGGASATATGLTATDHIHTYTYTASKNGHVGTCTVSSCGATTAEEKHYGGIANCGQGAICAVCGYEYTAKSNASHGNYEWYVEEGKDVYACQVCGEVAKEFITDYTAECFKIDQYAQQTLNISEYFENATYSNFVFNGVDLSGEANAISFANVTDKAKHGEHELTFTVTVDGQAHNVKFTVLLITRSFKAGEEAAFRDTVRAVAGDGAVKGLYRITTDLTCDSTTFPENWSAIETGTDYFAGTIVGEKADGSAPVIKVNAQYGGTFHYLQGATFKNLVFEDINYKGSSDQFATLIAAHIIDTTFENVTFKVTGGTASDQKTSGGVYGWLANKTTTGCTFVNVNFENTVAGLSVGNVFTCNSYSGNTFENCYIAGFDSVTYIGGASATATGLTAISHFHSYAYAGTETGHIGTCTYSGCGATTAEEAHFGGVANCVDAGTCTLCGYAYIPAQGGAHDFGDEKLESDESNHYFTCKNCGVVDETSGVAHSGGSATCANGAFCEVCGVEYGEVSATHTGTYQYVIGAHADEKVCSVCGEVAETFHTDYTAELLEVDQYAKETLNISSYFAGATVSDFLFNGVALSGEANAISFDNVTDLQKHGDHEMTATVNHDDHTHKVKFAVRLITRSFGAADASTMAGLVRGLANDTKTNIYGFYRVTEDLDGTYTVFPESYNLPNENETLYGFAGTIYGEKEDGSAPIFKVTPKFGGTFGYLVGATFKNLVFEDHDYYGSSNNAYLLIAPYAKNCTFEDITFRVSYVSESNMAAKQETTGFGIGWIINKNAEGSKFINVNFECNVEGVSVGRLIGGGTATFTNCYISGFESVGNIIGESATVEGVSSPVNVIVLENDASDYLRRAAFDLQTNLQTATGLIWAVQEENQYAADNNFTNKIVLGNVAAFAESATYTANAMAKGGASYAMKADGTTVYLCGANDYGIQNAIYEFLEVYFGYERYSLDYSVINTAVWTDETAIAAEKVLDLSDGVKAPFLNNSFGNILQEEKVGQMRYSADLGSELLMYVQEGVYDSKMHNAFSWLPVDKNHKKWYAKEKVWYGTKQAYNELCYTAQGDTDEYAAMIAACVKVAKAAVAFPENEGKYYLPFLKRDAAGVCMCSTCEKMAEDYGSKSATVVQFMNDLMTAIEADNTFSRQDFDLVFFAYEEFELAPTNMTLHERVTVYLAAPYTFNYQAGINDESNATGKANLKNWSKMSTSGDVWLWTYSAKFSDYFFPVDTFAFYNEETFDYFKECGVTVFFNQGQWNQTGTMTAWSNLKLYLDGQLMQDSSATQSALIAEYMTATFGPAAESMTNFFNSVRTATQNADLLNLYKNSKDGTYTLLGNNVVLRRDSKSCWSQADIQGWLNYCAQAYTAIDDAKAAGTIDEATHARIKKAIDIEWISPAYMHLCFYGETGTATKANILSTVNAYGITLYGELQDYNGTAITDHINSL